MSVFNKEEFVKIIDELQQAWDFGNRINDVLSDYPDCGYVFPPDGIDAAIQTLMKMYDDPYDIEYFCYELDFGRDWKPGMCKDKDGNDVCFATAADLYDVITRGENENGE